MTDMNVSCFLSLVSTGDIAVTARIMGVSKAAVTQNIRRLEEELGVPLFIGTESEARLSDAGHKYHRYFRNFEVRLSRLSNELAMVRNMPDLNVAWSEYTPCPDVIRRAIKEFSAANPDVNLLTYQASPPNLLKMLLDGMVDIIFSSRYLTNGIEGAFTATVLCETPLYLLMAEDSIYADMCISDIFRSDVPILATYAFEKNDAEVTGRVDRELIKMGYRLRPVNVQPNLDSVYLNVRMGLGLTMVPINDKTRIEGVFKRLELDRTVTLSMTRLQSNTSSNAARFEAYVKTILNETGGGK